GHRARGGHAGAEPAIRFVRACVAGGPPATFIQVPKAEPFTVHLVDLARLLSDSLALAPAPGSVGRPLAFARAHPGFGATLPSRGWGRVVVAAAFVLMALVAAAAWLRRTCRQRGSRVGPRLSLWLWVPVALAGIFALRGWPSLSTPAIYPPQGRDLVIAALPGLLGLVGWLCALAWPGGKRRPHDARHTATALAGFALVPGIALGLASLSVCGAFVPLFDSSAGPPLSPLAAPLASMTLAVLGGAALLLALVAPALDVAAQVRASRPDSRKARTDVEERDDRREKRDS
ncbi:MAG TPA: hypothetical protein VGG33_00290, partial [Polyangia bacterium]